MAGSVLAQPPFIEATQTDRALNVWQFHTQRVRGFAIAVVVRAGTLDETSPGCAELLRRCILSEGPPVVGAHVGGRTEAELTLFTADCKAADWRQLLSWLGNRIAAPDYDALAEIGRQIVESGSDREREAVLSIDQGALEWFRIPRYCLDTIVVAVAGEVGLDELVPEIDTAFHALKPSDLSSPAGARNGPILPTPGRDELGGFHLQPSDGLGLAAAIVAARMIESELRRSFGHDGATVRLVSNPSAWRMDFAGWLPMRADRALAEFRDATARASKRGQGAFDRARADVRDRLAVSTSDGLGALALRTVAASPDWTRPADVIGELERVKWSRVRTLFDERLVDANAYSFASGRPTWWLWAFGGLLLAVFLLDRFRGFPRLYRQRARPADDEVGLDALEHEIHKYFADEDRKRRSK